MDIKATKEVESEELESESVSNVHRELAVKASELFDMGDFAGSLALLKKLQEQRPLDTRFTHNAAVVEFNANNFKNVKEFKEKLNSVCAQGEINLDNVESLDDVRNSYIYFNYAVLLYHSMQYSSALVILNKMFSYVDVLDEELSCSVTLLLVETLLRIHKPEKALSALKYLENGMSQMSTSMTSPVSSENASSTERVNDTEETVNAKTESFKLKMKVYKCKCYLSLHNLEDAKKELIITSDRIEKIVYKYNNLSEELHHARCKNMICNIKCLIAYSKCLRRNFKSCVQTMASISLENNFEKTGDSMPLAFYNNLGCIHLYTGKPTLSTLYFRKALRENDNNRKLTSLSDNDKFLFTYGYNKLPQLVYNLGISLLHSGKPIEAFDCLTLAIQIYHMNPRLWLRLAECCIMVHKHGNDRDFDFINKRKEVLQEVIGSGVHRKLILNLNLFENNKYSYDAQSFAIPVASLEFATLCLRNALLLLSGPRIDCSPSNPMSTTQIASLRGSVLISSAYVSLCLGDPIVAMNNCRNVLSLPNCSNVHKLLAHLYITEAFVVLDRIPEALEHLTVDFSNQAFQEDSLEPNSHLKKWRPDSSSSWKAVFQYNLAVALALDGDLLKAADLLKQVWLTKGPQCEIPVQIISLALYIELSLGHADVARNIIKQNCPQYSGPSL